MVELVLSKGVSIRPKGSLLFCNGCTSFCQAWMIISFGQIANQADRPGHICVYGWVISSWNPLFQTPAYTSLAVMYFEGRCIVWPFKTLIPWLRRGFCPVSNLTVRYAEVSTDMKTSFDPSNHPTPIPNILNKAIFDSCLLQDQKWPCLYWLRNDSFNNYCFTGSFFGYWEKTITKTPLGP